VTRDAVWLEDDRRLTVNELIRTGTENSELVDVANAGPGPDEVDDHVDRGCQLAVHGVAAESGRDTQGLDPGRQVGRGVGVDSAAAALVSGVEGGE